jgi:CheY-like chemotaxis protein
LLLTGRKLLLADDSLTYQKVVSLILGDEGMEVVAVGSGAAALKALEQDAPDIVLADVFMPEPNGYEVCAHIKRDARLRHIPVLLLVGTFEPFDEAEARRVGADDVLTKPFQSIRELVSKVGNLLSGRTAEPQTEEPAAHTPAEPEHAHTATEMHAHADAPQEHVATPPTFPWARRQETPAQTPALQDFDMDDQTIQTTPAEAFAGRAADTTEAAAPFVVLDEEPSTTAQAAPESAPALELAPALESAPALSYAAAAASSSAPEFVARTAQAAPAEEALLDLDEFTQHASSSAADEFILDLGDEETPQIPAPPEAEESRVLYAEGLASSPAEAAAPLLTEEAAHTDVRALEADAQAYMQPPQSGQALEQVLPGDAEDVSAQAATPQESYEAETWQAVTPTPAYEWAAPEATTETPAPHEPAAPESFTHEPTTDEPAAQAPAWTETTETAPHEAAAAGEASAPESLATAAAEEQHAPAAAESALAVEAQTGTAQLSPETIDAIARRVVELMSDKVVREVVWEVVPELAERLIKRRIAEEQTQ